MVLFVKPKVQQYFYLVIVVVFILIKFRSPLQFILTEITKVDLPSFVSFMRRALIAMCGNLSSRSLTQ